MRASKANLDSQVKSLEGDAPGVWLGALRRWVGEWQSSRGPATGSPANTAWLALGLAIGYFVLGQLSAWTAGGGGEIAGHVFYAKGLALAFVILFGLRVAPGVVLGQLALGLSLGAPLLEGCLTALLYAGEAAVGGYLFWRLRISPRLKRPRDVLALLGLIVLVLQAMGIGGSWGIQYLVPEGLPHMPPTGWLAWGLANALGQVLAVALVLTSLEVHFDEGNRKEFRRGLLVCALYIAPLLLLGLIGGDGMPDWLHVLAQALVFLPLVILAVLSRPWAVVLGALLLVEPFFYYAAGAPGALPYWVSGLVLFCAVLTGLLVSAVREQEFDRNRKLQDGIRGYERLLGVIGHDLRGPLAMAGNYLDLMIEGDLSEADFREVQHDLRKGLDQANSILTSLLEWAEVKVTRKHPPAAEFDLRAAAEESVQLLSLTAQYKDLRLRNMIPSGACVLAREHQIRAVLRNLLSNAIKFSHRNSEVTITAELAGEFWKIGVHDSGVGIQELHSVFRPADAPNRTLGTENERGIGLGLQICRSLVQGNKGSLWVASRDQGGASFCFTLPATLDRRKSRAEAQHARAEGQRSA